MCGDTEIQSLCLPASDSGVLTPKQRKHIIDNRLSPNNFKKVRSESSLNIDTEHRQTTVESSTGAENTSSNSATCSISAENYTSNKVLSCNCGCGRSLAVNELQSVLKKPSTSNKTRRILSAALNMPVIHTVALVAHMLFSSFPNKHADADALTECLKSLIYRVTLSDLKVQSATSSIEYYPIWESETFTMCVFVLKKGVTMPIHDHPQMTVFSKVVSGDLLVKTFEFTDEIPDGLVIPSNARLSKIGINGIISASSPDSLLMIRPDFGPTMHSFTAASEAVVILDIIGPPYNDERPCTYYHPYLPDNSGHSSPSSSTSLYSSSPPHSSTPLNSSPPRLDSSPSPNSTPNLKNSRKKKKKRTKNNGTPHPSRSVDITLSNLQLHSLSSSPTNITDFDSQAQEMFNDSDVPQNVKLNSDNDSWKILRNGGTLTPPSEYLDYCILVEDPDIDYECTERRYIGQTVRAADLQAMETVSSKDLLRLARGVLGMLSSRVVPHSPNKDAKRYQKEVSSESIRQ